MSWNRKSLSAAMAGVESAYYFVHSMGSTDDFEVTDRLAARNFAEAAREAGVQRIIYLGGLGDEDQQLSPHLRSRHEVGQILRSTGVQVIEFRASIVLGSGSLSFEMIRALVDKLPVMITPRWVAVPRAADRHRRPAQLPPGCASLTGTTRGSTKSAERIKCHIVS